MGDEELKRNAVELNNTFLRYQMPKYSGNGKKFGTGTEIDDFDAAIR